ncbi:zf-HC2 domain-containing protein [Solibacillus sp. FSL K6-1523]|uniref:zf-HC2 domain-containing protein n=1 Tax=Solibacillus sp. FSL K6-1523 TaxID=2921471 RepID=UPI0030F7670A
MKCDLNVLEDYVEGFLEAKEQQKIENHLRYCKNCQNEYKQLVNEQKNLFAQLNTPMLTHSQSDAIMQRIQMDTKRKKTWHTLKISVISAAVIMLSFTLYYWNQTPNEMTQPIEEPIALGETNSSTQVKQAVEEPILNYSEPFLDVAIDEVVENGENIDIHYRVKFKEPYQQDQDNLYKHLLNKYQYIEVANIPRVVEAQDDFFGKVRSKVQFAIRDETGNLILATFKTKEGEQPMIPEYSSSGGGTDILGEMIYTTSVPKYTKPATFEVLQMEASIFDLFEVEVNPTQLQPFQFHNVTYTIDSLEIKQDIFHITISTEGKPEVLVSNWNMEWDNRLIGFNNATKNYINNRTVYKLEFENFTEVPDSFKLIPTTIKVKNRVNPIVLKLD